MIFRGLQRSTVWARRNSAALGNRALFSTDSGDSDTKFRPREALTRNDSAGQFGIFIGHAINLKTINMGQGFPDFPPPDFVLESIASMDKSSEQPFHQYTKPQGYPGLHAEVAQEYSSLLNRDIDPNTEVLTSNGAAGSINVFFNSFCKPGDEIVTFEPVYAYYTNLFDILSFKSSYIPIIKDTTNNTLTFDRHKFEKSITESTRVLLLNSPHNPTSKVFSMDEYRYIADIVKKYPNLIVVSDEVYYNITFDGNKHVSFASLPGMFERTLTLFSFGKTFSCTGWRLGFAIGPKELIKYMANYQTFTTFCVNVPAMRAAEKIFQAARQSYRGHSNYYDWCSKDYQSRKDRIVSSLRNKWKFDVIEPEGGFFCIADISTKADGLSAEFFFKDQKAPLQYSSWRYSSERKELPKGADYTLDFAYAIKLSLEDKLTSWPLSGFYSKGSSPMPAIRFSLCKSDASIDRLTKS